MRLPKLALPILAYWLTVGGITYELIHLHDAPSSALEEQPAATAPEPQPAQSWWQRVMAGAGAPLAHSPGATEPEPEPAHAAQPQPAPAATPATPALDDEASAPDAPVVDQPPSERGADRSARAAQRRSADDASPPGPAPQADDASQRATTPSDAEPTRPELALGVSSLSNRDTDTPDSPALTPSHADLRTGRSLPGCEAAAAAASEELDMAHRAVTPDLPREAIAAVLDNGAWLTGCSIPDGTALDVCVAISSGNVIGATVVARPGNSALSACLKRRAAALFFPYSSHLDLARTHFDAH
ncbi:MAG TPA: hypothetical protein VK745_00980 [Polyangiaceae bacterium]|nr:hypothetical protein [Polyangiaceae bacterium]